MSSSTFAATSPADPIPNDRLTLPGFSSSSPTLVKAEPDRRAAGAATRSETPGLTFPAPPEKATLDFA
jgi:hypothetical protein